MRSLHLGSRVIAAAIASALLFCHGSTSAGGSVDEICNVDADTALGLADYSAAIVLHRELLHADSHNALAHYHLGFAYGMSGNTAEEIREYLQASRLGLSKWDLFLNLGLAYMEQNEQQHAIEALHRAVLLGPNHAESHFDMAIAYENIARLREALTEIGASLDLAPEDPDARNLKAIICAQLGDLGCARTEWHRALQIAPDYEPARNNLMLLNGSAVSSPTPIVTRFNDFGSDPLNQRASRSR
jgi:Flp pilus assembly protein TadD